MINTIIKAFVAGIAGWLAAVVVLSIMYKTSFSETIMRPATLVIAAAVFSCNIALFSIRKKK